MREFYDGQEVTLNDVCDDWILDSFNPYTGTSTYYNEDWTLGVSFYDGYNKGTIFRAE